MHTSPLLKRRELSGTALKRIALVSMLLDHIGASCLEAGLFARLETVSAPLQALDLCLRWAGRLAFPLYCFLLVEGFVHTRNVRRYGLRLLAFALLSELPFDLAFFGATRYSGHQNVYFTLFFGLGALSVLERSAKNGTPTLSGYLGALAFGLMAELMHTDYGMLGILLIAALYLERADRRRQCLLGALIVTYELPAPLAFLPAACYNGQRGKCERWEQWAFYWFYPLHLAALAAVTMWVV